MTMKKLKAFIFWIPFVALTASAVDNAALWHEANIVRFGTPDFSIGIDSRTGAWTEFRINGRVAASGNRDYAFHLKSGEPQSAQDLANTRFIDARQVETNTLEVAVSADDGKDASRSWKVICEYQLFPEERALRQTFRVAYTGNGREKIRGFSQRSPYLKLEASGGLLGLPQSSQVEPYRPGDIFLRKAKETWSRVVIAGLTPNFSLVAFSDQQQDYSDFISCGTLEDAHGFQFGRTGNPLGWMKSGEFQSIGDFWVYAIDLPLEEARKTLHDFYRKHGWGIPAASPLWLRRASIYCTHPGGTIDARRQSRRGFRELAEYNLPHVADLGCNLYHLLPVENRELYIPDDYFQLQDEVGTADDFRAFVDAAHQRNIRVFSDIVPHGGTLYDGWNSKILSKRAKNMEQLTLIDEKGKRQEDLIFDYLMPEWQDYMKKVARYFMTEYHLDGFRIDAVSGSQGTNWREGRPYGLAGRSRTRGGFAMQKAIREAVKEIRPDDGAILAETEMIPCGSTSDLIYDFHLKDVFDRINVLPPEKFVPLLRNFLAGQQDNAYAGQLFMRYVESHDTVHAVKFYGTAPMRAMFAVCAWSYGVPLLHNEQDNGSGEIFRRILHLRGELPEFAEFPADYQNLKLPPEIFGCIRKTKDALSMPLVNFSDVSLRFQVKLPMSELPESLRNAERVEELWSGAILPVKKTAETRDFTVSLPPYGMALPRFELKAPEVKKSTSVSANRIWQPEILFLQPDGTVVKNSDLFQLKQDGDEWVLKSTAAISPEGGLLLRFPLRKEEKCSWEARSSAGLHQDYYRVRFPNSPGVYSPWGRNYAPVDHNVLWSSLEFPFGFTPAESRIAFFSPSGSWSAAFDPNRLPGNAAILDRVGADHTPHLFIGLRAGRGVVASPVPEVRFRTSPAEPQSLFAFGSGDDRFRPVPGGWRYDDGKLRLEIKPSGMIARAERLEGENWKTLLSNTGVKVSALWTEKSPVHSSDEVIDTFRRFERKPDGTLVLRFSGFPRSSSFSGMFERLHIVDYATEIRIMPDGDFDFAVGCRTLSDENREPFRVNFYASSQAPDELRVIGQNVPAAKVLDLTMLQGKIPLAEIGKWNWLAVSTRKSAKDADFPFPTIADSGYRYCFDGGFEQLPLSLVTQTVQYQRPYYDWIQSTPSETTIFRQPHVPGAGVDWRNPYRGNYSLSLTGKSGEMRHLRQALQGLYFLPGSNWKLSVALRGEALENGSVQVFAGKNPLGKITLPAGNSTWREYSLDFTVPKSGIPEIWICTDGGGTLFADELRLDPKR